MTLAVPVPASEVPGNLITGALWNANVFNGLTYLLNPPDFIGIQTATQSLASGSATAILLDTETLDTYGGHSTTTNTSRYTAQAAGWYTVGGAVSFAANATGPRQARIQINGTAVQGHAAQVQASATGLTTVATPVRDIHLNVGDYVELVGYQAAGASVATSSVTDQASMLWCRWSHV